MQNMERKVFFRHEPWINDSPRIVRDGNMEPKGFIFSDFVSLNDKVKAAEAVGASFLTFNPGSYPLEIKIVPPELISSLAEKIQGGQINFTERELDFIQKDIICLGNRLDSTEDL